MTTSLRPAARSQSRRSACCGLAARSAKAIRYSYASHFLNEQRNHMSAIGSVDELLARASSRTEVRPGDGKAGARYERVLVGGGPFFVQQLSPASDWIMRVTGDHVHRPYLVWRSGIMARSPGCIDHTVVRSEERRVGKECR